jgi:hypothetical protein
MGKGTDIHFIKYIPNGAMNNFKPECCHFSIGKVAMNARLFHPCQQFQQIRFYHPYDAVNPFCAIDK